MYFNGTSSSLSTTSTSTMTISPTEFKLLQTQSNRLHLLDTVNMYVSIFLVTLGFFGNLSALAVLIFARNKLPRLIGVNNLILLTITNTAYLFIQSYMYTFTRIILHLGIGRSLQFFDSSQLVCKLVLYLRNTTRLLNALMTVCFSFERLLAVYYPLRIRTLEKTCERVTKFSVALSFILPSYSLYFIELIKSDAARDVHERLNVTKAFSFNSVAPVIGPYTCAATKFKLSVLLHYLLYLVVFFSYIVVSFCIIAIVIKLKRKKLFKFKSRPRPSPANNNPTQTETQRLENSSAEIDVKRLRRQQRKQRLILIRSIRVIQNKAHDTKMLTSISVSFVIFNAPYIAAMFYFLLYTLQVDNLYAFSIDHIINKIQILSIVVIAEVFQLINFSVTGMLFYFYGRIFCTHARTLYRKILFCRY